MPKLLHNALNPKAVAATDTPGTYADGNGLALFVKLEGTKSWIWRGKLDGRATRRGLGGYPLVSLAEARKAAKDLGLQAKERQQPKPPKVPTFRSLANEVIELRRPTWTNAKHATQWAATLETYCLGITKTPVDQVKTADVLDILMPIWTVKHETASRVRQRMESVFDLAIAKGWRQDNPAGRHLLRVLPKAGKLKKNHRALPYAEVPRALKRVRRSTSYPSTKMALEVLVLTASRSGEVRLADWSEVDWETRTWTVPATRMKARKEHRVPLAAQTMTILREVWELSGPDGLIFPTKDGQGELSDMTLNRLLQRLKVDAVPHGFRSSFRDWAAEQSGASWAVCESALAHVVGNSVEQAYMRSDLLEQRRSLMQQWADFCTG